MCEAMRAVSWLSTRFCCTHAPQSGLAGAQQPQRFKHVDVISQRHARFNLASGTAAPV